MRQNSIIRWCYNYMYIYIYIYIDFYWFFASLWYCICSVLCRDEPNTWNCRLADSINRRPITTSIGQCRLISQQIFGIKYSFILQFPGEFIERQLELSHEWNTLTYFHLYIDTTTFDCVRKRHVYTVLSKNFKEVFMVTGWLHALR